MRLVFTIKYIGKTALIMFAVIAMAKQAKMADDTFYNILGLASLAYCIGSIKYQFMRKSKKRKTHAYYDNLH